VCGEDEALIVDRLHTWQRRSELISVVNIRLQQQQPLAPEIPNRLHEFYRRYGGWKDLFTLAMIDDVV